jgi:hypothetical protein
MTEHKLTYGELLDTFGSELFMAVRVDPRLWAAWYSSPRRMSYVVKTSTAMQVLLLDDETTVPVIHWLATGYVGADGVRRMRDLVDALLTRYAMLGMSEPNDSAKRFAACVISGRNMILCNGGHPDRILIARQRHG